MLQVIHPLDDNSLSLTIPITQNRREVKNLVIQELNKIPMLAINLRLIRFLGLLYDHNWRRYVAITSTGIFNLSQLLWMFTSHAPVEIFIHYAYMLVLCMNTLLRGLSILLQKRKYERFLFELIDLYREILNSGDIYLTDLLNQTNKSGQRAAIINLILGASCCLSVCLFMLSNERLLPYGVYIPGLNTLESPVFEIMYAYELALAPIAGMLYIPFGNLIVVLIMFGILMCKVLQYRLRNLQYENHKNINNKLIWCIKYQQTIIRYVHILNSLTNFVFLIEFLTFMILLCGILFLLNMAQHARQIIMSGTQITMLSSQILMIYWYANELSDATANIAVAAYDTPWFLLPNSLQKKFLILIMRAQKPCNMTIGNINPMSLQLFQSLINASYTYYTILRQVYK